MKENKDLLLKGAMSYGLIMGIFWVIKYIFLILSYSYSAFIFIHQVLSFAIPFIAYRMTMHYKRAIGGKIRFFHAWQFGVLLYFFAALIVSVEHYIFYQFIAPPDFLANAMELAIVALKETQIDSEVINSIRPTNFTPIRMTIQGIFNNIFYGVILSVPVAILVCRKQTTITAK